MSRTLTSIAGFLLAAVTAPAVSLTIYLLASPLAPPTLTMVRLPAADIGLAYVFATLIGVVPSVVFGGLTLLVMRRWLRPWPPGLATQAAGGLTAALLYSLASTLLRVGPWGGSRPWEDPAAATVMGCVVLSGAVAGLIYAPFANRG